jgi:glycosyltransferase involved in cell wall biosynthesis
MLFSIGLPAYKSQYLEEAIQSILNQTYKDFELIILNDASPEPVEEIIKKFNDPRIRYCKNDKNLGGQDLALCWNLTLRKATGKYFVLASDDDYYEPVFLEKMAGKVIQYPEVDIFHCRLRLVNASGETLDISSTCNEYEDVLDFMWNRIIKKRNQMLSEFMFKTSALLNIDGFYSIPAGWFSDDITCCMLARANGIVFVNEVLCSWRNSGKNISSSHNYYYQKMLAAIKFKTWFKDFLNSMESSSGDNPFYKELKAKAFLEIEAGLFETAARFIIFAKPVSIFKNLRICKRNFNIKIRNILGVLLESYGKKLKNRI